MGKRRVWPQERRDGGGSELAIQCMASSEPPLCQTLYGTMSNMNWWDL